MRKRKNKRGEREKVKEERRAVGGMRSKAIKWVTLLKEESREENKSKKRKWKKVRDRVKENDGEK